MTRPPRGRAGRRAAAGPASTPGGIRTPNLRFRRPLLYPVELRVRHLHSRPAGRADQDRTGRASAAGAGPLPCPHVHRPHPAAAGRRHPPRVVGRPVVRGRVRQDARPHRPLPVAPDGRRGRRRRGRRHHVHRPGRPPDARSASAGGRAAARRPRHVAAPGSRPDRHHPRVLRHPAAPVRRPGRPRPAVRGARRRALRQPPDRRAAGRAAAGCSKSPRRTPRPTRPVRALRELVILFGWRAVVEATDGLLLSVDRPAWACVARPRRPRTSPRNGSGRRGRELLPEWVAYLHRGVAEGGRVPERAARVRRAARR